MDGWGNQCLRQPGVWHASGISSGPLFFPLLISWHSYLTVWISETTGPKNRSLRDSKGLRSTITPGLDLWKLNYLLIKIVHLPFHSGKHLKAALQPTCIASSLSGCFWLHCRLWSVISVHAEVPWKAEMTTRTKLVWPDPSTAPGYSLMPLCALDYSLGESPDPELHVHTDSSLRSSVSPSAVFNKLSSEMSRADK